jgi:ATP-binding cassette subfamily C protein CydCD
VLLDEPTAHLDAAGAEALMADLRAALTERIVVLVTHHSDEAHLDDVRIRLGHEPALR